MMRQVAVLDLRIFRIDCAIENPDRMCGIPARWREVRG